jgi:hypothetical protein
MVKCTGGIPQTHTRSSYVAGGLRGLTVMKDLKLRIWDVDERALVNITWRRWTLRLFMWVRPGVEWGRWGYDCIWRTWAVYPLFEVEMLDREIINSMSADI